MSIFAWITLSLVIGFIASTVDPRIKMVKIEKALGLALSGGVFGGVLASLILGFNIMAVNLSTIFISSLVSMQILYFGKNIKILQ